jgi:hypothetical protein
MKNIKKLTYATNSVDMHVRRTGLDLSNYSKNWEVPN